MNLIKYGIVFVSAGISITGALWFTRGNAVSGEDVAECMAAVTERSLWNVETGDSFAFASNVVQSGVSWYPLYTTILCGARDMAITETSAQSLFWLDPSIDAPADGSVLASNRVTWFESSTDTYNSTTRHYMDTRTDDTGYDVLPTSVTRMPTNAYCLRAHPITLDFADATNCPFSELFYNTSTNTLATEWTYGNFWTRCGLGTNVYHFSCERVTDYDALTVEEIVNAGITVSPPQLVFMHNDYAAKTVTVTAGAGNPHSGAGAFRVTGPDRFDNVFAVADWQYSRVFTSETGTYNKKTAFTPTSGNTITLSVSHEVDWPGGVSFQTISIVALGAGVSVDQASMDIDYTLRTLTVTVTPGSAGLVKFTCDNGDSYIAVANQGTSDITVTPSVRQLPYTDTETSTFAVSVSTAKTNITARTNKGVSTNNLNDARALMRNLKRTMWIAPYNVVNYAAVTNYIDYGEYGSPLNTSIDVDTAMENAYAALSDFDSGTTWGGEIAGVESSGFTEEIKLDTESYQTFASVYRRSVVLNGCTLDYPSLYAITNGYVSKISVYIVAWDGDASERIHHLPDLTLPGTTTYTGDSEQANGSNDDLGTGYNVTYATSGAFSNDTDVSSWQINGTAGNTPQNVTLTLIAEQTDPTEQVTFDLGNRSFTMPQTWHGYDYQRDVDATHYEKYDARTYNHSVIVTHFVVVVEWKWKHFADTAFVPESNVPAWLNHGL